jgi:hypothetical protein
VLRHPQSTGATQPQGAAATQGTGTTGGGRRRDPRRFQGVTTNIAGGEPVPGDPQQATRRIRRRPRRGGPWGGVGGAVAEVSANTAA